MAKYNKDDWKNILSVWLNINKDGKGVYLSIKNETTEPITIEPGRSIFANMNTRRPIASKSVKIEDQVQSSEDIAGDVPF